MRHIRIQHIRWGYVRLGHIRPQGSKTVVDFQGLLFPARLHHVQQLLAGKCRLGFLLCPVMSGTEVNDVIAQLRADDFRVPCLSGRVKAPVVQLT